MERPPSITSVSEEVYDLADVLEKPKRRADWTVARRSPILCAPEDTKFPVLPPTQSASGPRLSQGLRIKRALQAYKEEIHEHKGPALLPVFDITAQEEVQRNAQIVAAAEVRRTPTPPPTWKQERELRIQNAMARVQQSYVSNVKNLYAPDPYSEDEQPRYTPTCLEPVHPSKTQVVWDEDRFKRNRRVTERVQKTYVDDLRPPRPPKTSSRQEVEIDEKRQGLMHKRRKQKEDKVKGSHRQLAPPIQAHYDPIKPQASHMPAPPPSRYHADDVECYSKRKRKVKATQPSDDVLLHTMDVTPKPPEQEKSSSIRNVHSLQAPIYHDKEAHRHAAALVHDVDPNLIQHTAKPQSQASHTANPHPPLIPRQVSTNIRSWNSDTAKRGLGFKSKLRRESEQASSNKVTESKSESISPHVRQKWKKATFN